MNYKELAQSVEQYAIDLRRHFHMYPEISLQEEKTSARICEELEAMGIPYDVVGNRNVVGRIECGEGKKIAIRADIDALPMQEEIEWEFKSKIDGVMHACGHDAHAACLLATAKALLQVKDELPGTIYLCFQVAEEISGGGPEAIVAYLKERGGVDQVFSTHITPSMPTGVIGVKKQAMFAGNCKWKIVVTGQGAEFAVQTDVVCTGGEFGRIKRTVKRGKIGPCGAHFGKQRVAQCIECCAAFRGQSA